MALNDVIYNKKVDVAQAMPVPVVFAKQNDNAKRKVVVTLVKNGQPFVFGTGVNGYIQGATAPNPVTKRQIKFKRDLTAIDTTQGTATFIITESMTAEIGITQCEVALYDTAKPNEIICTANINIEVQGTGMSPQDEMASDDYQAIVSIKAEVTAMRDEVRTKTAEAIAAQGAAETAAQNAYNSALGVQKIVAGNEAYTKQEADLKYSVAPRKAQSTTTGEMRLTDSDDGLSYLALQGNSEQYTATGKNLFDVKQLVKTMQAISPSSITIGQDSNGKFMQILNSAWLMERCLEFANDTSKSYKIGFKTKYISGTGVSLYLGVAYKDGTTKIVFYGHGQPTQYTEFSGTIPAGKEIDYLYFSYSSSGAYFNVLLDSFYLYPIDVPSSERPTGGYGTPSPEYPSEVKSVGDIPKDVNGVEIRNLLDEEWIKNQPESAWTKNTSGTIFSIEVALPKTRLYIRTPDFNATDAEGTTFGISKKPGSLAVADGIYFYKTTLGSFDFSGQEHIYIILGRKDKNWDLAKKSLMKARLMVTSAAEIDEYRPYIGENNGLIKLESIGINRVNPKQVSFSSNLTIEINKDSSIIKLTQQAITNSAVAYVYFNYEKGKGYTLYCRAKFIELSGTGGRSFIGIRDKTGADGAITQQIINTNNVINEILINFTALQEGLAVMLYPQPDVNLSIRRLEIYDLMVVEGTKTLQEMKALKYQPYQNKITWIPLREPLRKIGDYADSVDKWGNVVQRIQKDVLDNIVYFSYYQSESQGATYLFQVTTPIITNNLPAQENIIMSNILKKCPNMWGMDVEGIGIGGIGFVLYDFRILKTKFSGEPTKEKLQSIIKEGVTYYSRREVITYQIPAVYIETYEPTTNVRCMNEVKPSTMGLDYKLAISSLIKRLEALESAAVNNGGK